MKPRLFLSDLHLSPERPAAARAFQSFCDGPALASDGVYVLGDLFDWWIGDDQLSDRFDSEVAAGLRRISGSGVPLFFAHGNRDFLVGERFAAATGARLLPERERLDLFGTPTLVSHGDELCTSDTEYQRYRARMRSPATQRRLLRLPLLARRGIAHYLRRKSRDATALKPEAILDVDPAAVEQAFRDHAVTRLIHGHTHRPARHLVNVDGIACERIVLADWHDRGHYLEASPQGLVSRDID